MFYSFIRVVARITVWVLNGRLRVLNKEKLPQGNYILVGPHRTWFDPILFALAAAPKKFAFMAKVELFKNPVLRFILEHSNGFPVDRKNPGPSAVKTPVKWLRKRDLSLIMFPSGTRHSAQLKGGVVLIAKLANVPIVPAVYQGPLTVKGLLKRSQTTIAIGDPIELPKKARVNAELEQQVITQMNDAFAQLDKQIDPNFKYIAK